jgi:PncC family amidohydrolase
MYGMLSPVTTQARPPQGPEHALATEVVAALTARGSTVATAESLTGGMLASLLTSVPGASACVVGGVVSYATRVKQDLLGVPEDVVDRHGVVSGECAAAMAVGVRTLLAVDLGVATTGVAGPDLQEGKPAGTVWIAVATAEGTEVSLLALTGDRDAIRRGTCRAALELVLAVLRREDGALG